MTIEFSLLNLKNCNVRIFSRRRRVVQTKPIFFYHIPKTGGTMLRVVLEAAMGLLHQADKSRNVAPPGPYFGKGIAPPPEIRLENYSAVFAWEPYGFHRMFPYEFNLVTIVREPVARMVSRFRYLCHLGEQELTTAAFEKFFRAAPQVNHQTKLLAECGDFAPVNDRILARAVDHLEEFFAVATIENFQTLVENLFSAYDLPNVIGTRLNVSPPSTVFDWEPYRAEIRGLNEYDSRLFEHVAKNQRLCSGDENPDFLPQADDQPLNKFTILVREAGSDRLFEHLNFDTEKLEQDFSTVGQTKQRLEKWLVHEA